MDAWVGRHTYVPSFDQKTLVERCCLEDVVVFGKTVQKWILSLWPWKLTFK